MPRNRSVYTHPIEVIVPLHERYLAGEDAAALGAELGISPGALLTQFHHKGLGGRIKRHWWTAAELRLAKDRISKGDLPEDVARRIGVSESQLYRALLKVGFSAYTESVSPEKVLRRKEDLRILALRHKGLSLLQIAQEMGWPEDSSGQRRVGRRIMAYCERAGIPIPLVGEVLRRDGTRRRVGYGPKVREAVKKKMAARKGKDFT
jgi:AraC-like DNA-binding protein